MRKLFLVLAVAMAASGNSLFAQAPAAPAVERPVRTPPPPVTIIPSTRRDPMPVVPVFIELSAGSSTLWRGELNIGEGAPARVSISEPMPTNDACVGAYQDRATRQIEFSLGRIRSNMDDGLFQLTARYVRPADGGDNCGGSRTVSIEQRFSWSDGKRKSFDGDGGLKVVISRK